MLYYLIICTQVANGMQCLPLQGGYTKEQCHFVGRSYMSMSKYGRVFAKCIGMRP